MSRGRWPLYRWGDGAQIDIMKTVWEDYIGHCLEYVSTSRRFLLFIYASGSSRRMSKWMLSTKVLVTEPKICAQLRGFLADLGVRQHPQSNGLLRLLDSSPQIQTTLLGPSFIPDEVFDQRYEQIDRLWKEARKPGCWETFPQWLLGVSEVSLRIQQPGFILYAKQNLGEQICLTSEHKGKWDHIYSSNSQFHHLHRLVDQLVGYIPIRSESQRKGWETGNVERGTLLSPFAESFEIYRALDEELPIFWESSEFLPWVQEM